MFTPVGGHMSGQRGGICSRPVAAAETSEKRDQEHRMPTPQVILFFLWGVILALWGTTLAVVGLLDAATTLSLGDRLPSALLAIAGASARPPPTARASIHRAIQRTEMDRENAGPLRRPRGRGQFW